MNGRTFLVALVVFLLAIGASVADTRIVKKVHTEGMPGQDGPTDEEVVIWLGDDEIAQIGADNSFVARFASNEFVIVDHERQTYSTLALPIDVLSMFPEEMRGQIQMMMEQLKMSVTVTPTEETAEIGTWPAKRYNATITNDMGMKIETIMWNTDAIDVDMAAYERLTETLASMQPGGDWVTELTGVPGYTIKQEINVDYAGQSLKNVEEVVKVETAEAPAGTYAAPEGYEEKAFNPMEAMTGGQ